MCVVSMIGDHYHDKWNRPPWNPVIPPQQPLEPLDLTPFKGVSSDQFEQLRKEVLEMKELLKRAIKYDEKNNEPDCGKEDKISFLKKMAEMVGVDLSEVFKDETQS